MILLAFDTATASCAAAVWHDGQVLAGRSALMERGHAEALAPMIRDVMAECGVAFTALDGVAVTVGPGAFTGLRIGLAMARGIALSADIPCLGVTTLEAVATGIDPGSRAGREVIAVLDAKRQDVYTQRFAADLRPLEDPRAVLPDLVGEGLAPGAPVVLCGDAMDAVLPVLRHRGCDVACSESRHPLAPVVAAVAAARLGSGEPVVAPQPLYLRAPDASLPGSR